MHWSKFEKEYDITNTLSSLIDNCFKEFLQQHKDIEIIAFGVDCNASYFDIFLSILTNNGVKNIPKWQESWDWISEWDYYEFCHFWDNEKYQAMRTKIDELMFELDADVFTDIENNFINLICETFVGIQQKYSQLKTAELIVYNHGDMTSEARKRLEKLKDYGRS